VLYSGIVNFKVPEREYSASDLTHLSLKTLKGGKQAIIFVNTRRSAEAEAERIGKQLIKQLNHYQRSELIELSSKVLKVINNPTRQCRRLASCINNGVAFNHAGLVNAQKELIEDAFRQGVIKLIVCTTVLAYGVSLPAYQVILRDLRRYTASGLDYIPVSEYLQIKGRAGRAGYDSEGESVIITKSEADNEVAHNNYVNAGPEDILSKLGVEPVLRFHALSLVSEGSVLSTNDLVEFFKKTFHAKQYRNTVSLSEKLVSVIDELSEWGFIKRIGEKLVPTKLGVRVSQLYIDPLSAKMIIDSFNDLKLNALSLLHLVSLTGEVPCLSFRKSDYEWVLEELALEEDSLMIKTPNPFSYDYDGFMRAFKTSLLFNDWITERTEDDLLEKFDVPPGRLRVMLKNAEWMVYACSEIARVLGERDASAYLKGLILRLRYGVNEDLLSLVTIKGIGRVRARKLLKAGYRNVDELRNARKEDIVKLLGEKITEKIISS
jgi:helicase